MIAFATLVVLILKTLLRPKAFMKQG